MSSMLYRKLHKLGRGETRAVQFMVQNQWFPADSKQVIKSHKYLKSIQKCFTNPWIHPNDMYILFIVWYICIYNIMYIHIYIYICVCVCHFSFLLFWVINSSTLDFQSPIPMSCLQALELGGQEAQESDAMLRCSAAVSSETSRIFGHFVVLMVFYDVM